MSNQTRIVVNHNRTAMRKIKNCMNKIKDFILDVLCIF